MPHVTQVLIDPATDAAYYLGFDLLLVQAPLIDGEIRAADGRVVEADRDDAVLAARYAAIRLTLLTAMMAGSESWQPAIREALATARELASAAGMLSPPKLDGSHVSTLDLGGHS